jgi:hypothetical protein
MAPELGWDALPPAEGAGDYLELLGSDVLHRSYTL